MFFNEECGEPDQPPPCNAMEGYPSIALQGDLNPKPNYVCNLFYLSAV